MNEESPSYRCKINRGNTRALLRLGWHRYKVDVIEMSRDSFSVLVPKRVANLVPVGGKTKLLYQEMLWSVLCTQKWISNEKQVELEFKQLAELTPPKISKPTGAASVKGVQAVQSDNTLPIVFAMALIMFVLIMPAWGGQWGTSEIICNAVRATWDALTSLLTGVR